MENGSSLAKNTTMIGLGGMIAKITQFIVLSLCSYKLTTAEYGVADVCVSTAALIFPIITLDISEAVFRFAMDKTGNEKKIISVGLFLTVIGGIMVFLFYPIARYIPKIGGYWSAIALLAFCEALQIMFKEYVRGKQAGREYVIGGIVNSSVQIIGCLILVHCLSWAIWGFVLSLCMGYLAEFVYIEIKLHIFHGVSLSAIKSDVTKRMLVYSLPLIPNTVMWWIVSISDRYFIMYMIGEAAAGVYSVAAKVPALITVVTGIFFKAWQMSAIEVENEENRDEYTSKVFGFLWLIGAVCIAGILICLRILLKLFVAPDFQVAWQYSTILIVAAGFSSLQSFIGTTYTVQKDSIGCLKSTCVMALINIVLNYFLIRRFGIQGATLSTLVSYVFVVVYRYFDTRKYITLRFDCFRLIMTYILLIVESLCLVYSGNGYYIIAIIGAMLIYLLNMREINLLFRMVAKVIRKRQGSKR